MKKKTLILLAILTLISSATLDAQIRFGVKGGLSYSSFSAFEVGVLPESVNSHTGFNAGVAVCFHLPAGFAIQPELLYVSKGADFTNLSISTDYIELPVSIQCGLDLILLRPFLALTPYIGYSVSNAIALKENRPVALGSESMNKFEYGVGIGGGIDIWRLQLTARYKWNFDNLTKIDTTTPQIIDSATKNVIDAINKGNYKGFEISLGFFF